MFAFESVVNFSFSLILLPYDSEHFRSSSPYLVFSNVDKILQLLWVPNKMIPMGRSTGDGTMN
jgi:hypothetical protein